MGAEFFYSNPDTLIWRINRERIVLLAGPAAAVLQVAHPQVAMGVAAHSHFRSDAMGRLRRTLDAVYTVAFGDNEEVERVRVGVARAHRAVRGEGYSAFDPDAQLWVLATLIMGSVNMYQRFVRRLSAAELDQFVVENAKFGEIFGLNPSRIPKTWEDFQRYWKSMMEGDLLGSHPLCAEVANAVIRPDAPWFMRSLSPVLRSLTVEYLTPDLCRRLKIPSSSQAGFLWSTLDGILPALIPRTPGRLRFAPQYIRAVERARKMDGARG